MEREKNGMTPAIAELAVGIAIWEIAIKLKRLKQSDVVKIVAVDENVFVNSVNLKWSHRDPVARIMVALAMYQNCSIITKDKEIRKFYDNTIW